MTTGVALGTLIDKVHIEKIDENCPCVVKFKGDEKLGQFEVACFINRELAIAIVTLQRQLGKDLKRLNDLELLNQNQEETLNAYKEDNEELGEELTETLIKYNELCKEKLEWLKQKEVLEIIKKKVMPLVNVTDEEYFDNYAVYDGEMYKHTTLTENEFNLIKEWLEK